MQWLSWCSPGQSFFWCKTTSLLAAVVVVVAVAAVAAAVEGTPGPAVRLPWEAAGWVREPQFARPSAQAEPLSLA